MNERAHTPLVRPNERALGSYAHSQRNGNDCLRRDVNDGQYRHGPTVQFVRKKFLESLTLRDD